MRILLPLSLRAVKTWSLRIISDFITLLKLLAGPEFLSLLHCNQGVYPGAF
jgi:hypothetical protein